jgi:hypothetical protein
MDIKILNGMPSSPLTLERVMSLRIWMITDLQTLSSNICAISANQQTFGDIFHRQRESAALPRERDVSRYSKSDEFNKNDLNQSVDIRY